MTLLSHVMTHQKQKQLIEIQGDAEKLFKEVKEQGLPFFKWNDWIGNYIETSLIEYEQYKKNRLSNLALQG